MFGAMWLQAQGSSGLLGSPIFLIVIPVAIFYFLVILPQNRQRKKVQAMLAALKSGDKVITNGGIYGTVAGLDGEAVILRIADQVKIRIARSAIAQVEGSENEK